MRKCAFASNNVESWIFIHSIFIFSRIYALRTRVMPVQRTWKTQKTLEIEKCFANISKTHAHARAPALIGNRNRSLSITASFCTLRIRDTSLDSPKTNVHWPSVGQPTVDCRSVRWIVGLVWTNRRRLDRTNETKSSNAYSNWMRKKANEIWKMHRRWIEFPSLFFPHSQMKMATSACSRSGAKKPSQL